MSGSDPDPTIVGCYDKLRRAATPEELAVLDHLTKGRVYAALPAATRTVG